MNPALFRLATLFCGALFLFPGQVPDVIPVPDSLSGTDRLLADQLTNSVVATEWLGVLAPIAISPFFGITCLAGMSQFGGDIIGANSFVSTNPVLNNPVVFWIFLVLTISTSLPRLTKVSKPLAQAVDQLEAYSAIITLLVIRFMATSEPTLNGHEAVVMQMGVLAVTGNMLISLAAIINIVVINTAKFFIEILVWLTPIAFIDALLEAGNKLFCGGLMAIYAFSPLAATIFNLLMFAFCLVIYFWIRRRVVYARTLLIDPVWALVNNAYGRPTRKELIVFPVGSFLSFPAKSKLLMEPTEKGWKFTRQIWLMPVRSVEVTHRNTGNIMSGILMNQLHLGGPEACLFTFSRRYSGKLDEVARLMNVAFLEQEPENPIIDFDFT